MRAPTAAGLEGSNAIVIPPCAPMMWPTASSIFPFLVDERDAVLKGLMARGFLTPPSIITATGAELEVFRAYHQRTCPISAPS